MITKELPCHASIFTIFTRQESQIKAQFTENNIMHALLSQLNKAYFWDVDTTTIDAQKSRGLIIERVMLYGNLDEIKLVKDFYGKEALVSTICKLNYIDPKTSTFFPCFLVFPNRSLNVTQNNS